MKLFTAIAVAISTLVATLHLSRGAAAFAPRDTPTRFHDEPHHE